MKVEGRIYVGFVVFMGAAAVVYWYFAREAVGTVALGFTAFMSFLVGYYLLFTARRIDARPEDDPDAQISDGAGDLGMFSPYSWMPLAVGLSAALTTVGIVIGWWLAIIGVTFLVWSIVGFMFEYYRGDHAH